MHRSSQYLLMAAVFMFAVFISACGSNDATNPTSQSDALTSTPCNYCVVEDPSGSLDLPPPTGVHAYPTQLMFYWEITSNGDLAPPKEVTLTNYELTHVVIERIYISASQESHIGRGGAGYFSVDSPNGPFLLGPGEKITLHVSFAHSLEQRSAVLVIDTNHEANAQLMVKLDGKYFLDTL